MLCKTVLAILLAVGLLASQGVAQLTNAVLSAPAAFPAMPDDSVIVPLTLTGTGALDGCDVRITYDPTVLELPNVSGGATTDVTVGSLIPTWGVLAFLPGAQGLVNVSASGAVFPVDPSGNVLNVAFHVLPSAAIGSTPISLVDYNGMGWTFQSGSINIVPEPSSLVLLLCCLLAAGPVLLRRRNHHAV